MPDDPEPRRIKGTGVKFAYDTLRDDILSLTLPPGHPLDETTIADRFGMSRSPVREALIRLAGEDLVVMLSNRSTIVAPVDIPTFPKYVEALDIAQRMNTRLAAQLRTDADLRSIAGRQADFETAVRSGDHVAMSGANRDFHMAIAAAGRNPYLAAFYERLLDQGRRLLHLHFAHGERTHHGYLLTDEHAEMLDAIGERDVARADRLAQDHTRQFQAGFFDFLRANHLAGAPLDP